MKAFRLLENPGTRLTHGLLFGLALVLAGSLSSTSAVTVTANADVSVAAPTAVQYHSPGIAEVLQMVDAKVDLQVIRAYIKNSPVAYNPTASEIVALKERGVSGEIIVAMLQRGGEIRTQALQAAPA